jgi:hypothetical protein
MNLDRLRATTPDSLFARNKNSKKRLTESPFGMIMIGSTGGEGILVWPVECFFRGMLARRACLARLQMY